MTDYEKAFDQVIHEILVRCLGPTADGHEVQRSGLRMHVLEWKRQEIQIKRGVTQTCEMSQWLFNLYTETIFTEVENGKGVNIGGMNINILRCADDEYCVIG